MRRAARPISMLLCLSLLLSLIIAPVSAAFSDADKIVHTEAVAAMLDLNIMKGKEDGSYFDPEGLLTRGELCKIVALLLNGGQEPDTAHVSSPFSDTAGHWAARYINYCASRGLVAGRGNGTFAPDYAVTASEVSKVLLVALGYQAEAEGFVGRDWLASVHVRALQKDLYAGLDTVGPGSALSRDNTARMVFNALSAVVVSYESHSVTVDGAVYSRQVVVNDADGLTLLAQRYPEQAESN